MDVKLYPAPLAGTVAAPPSKSRWHRELICQAAAGRFPPVSPDAPEDIRGDPMFEMASAAGELEVIGDSKRAKRSNKPEKDPPEGGESRASGDAPPEV